MHHLLPIMFTINRNALTVSIRYMYRYLSAISGLIPCWFHGTFLRRNSSGHTMEMGIDSTSRRNLYQEHIVE